MTNHGGNSLQSHTKQTIFTDQQKHSSAEMLVAIWSCTGAQQFSELNANANIVAMIMHSFMEDNL